MADSAAALVDEHLRPPRQGDSDEGRGLLLDAPTPNRWPSLLALADALVGRLDWWPRPPADAGSVIVGALAGAKRDIEGRPGQRPSRFADAGVTLLRTDGDNEIWCRCDGGPHGYLSIAAHAHADALSVEVRYGGVDILADPGTYCYHGEPAWRSYFRSTIAHNTVELGGRSQSSERRPVHVAAPCARPGGRGRSTTATSPVDRGTRRLRLARPAGAASPLGAAGPGLAQHRHHRRDRGRQPRRPPCLPPRPRGAGRSSTNPARSWLARASTPERRGWNCRPGCGGACTGARPTPSSAGTPPASDAASPSSPSWVADAVYRLRRSPPGSSSSKPPSRRKPPFPTSRITR